METENALGLSTLLNLREDAPPDWARHEFAAILHHQLTAPLRLAMGILSAEVIHEMARLPANHAEIHDLGELFYEAEPPLALLQLSKRFAKLCDGSPESPLPREIGMVLYFASIAVARMRCASALSSLSESALARGLEWSCAQEWIDPRLRDLLQQAVLQLGALPSMGSGPRSTPETPN